jgi:hypothetical protein
VEGNEEQRLAAFRRIARATGQRTLRAQPGLTLSVAQPIIGRKWALPLARRSPELSQTIWPAS